AWPLTPPWPFGAVARFFPTGFGCTSPSTGSAHTADLRHATSTEEGLRGCSHCVMCRLPSWQDPQVAPTAGASWPPRSQVLYLTLWPCGYPSCTVISLRARTEPLTRLDFHQLDCGLASRYRTVPLPR